MEGQVHKDNKLGIMTNVDKTRQVKVIFTNICTTSDACANSFGRYIMTAQCMRNVISFIKFKFPWKNNVYKKIKADLPQHTSPLKQLFSSHLFNFIQNIFRPSPISKRGQRLCVLYERLQRIGNTVITILYDWCFIYRTVKSEHLKKI